MAEEMTVNARLEQGMCFQIQTGSGHRVTLESSASGQSAGPAPMEMLLASLAGCMGMSTLSILQKKRQPVSAYEVRVHGKRAEAYPKEFVEIRVEHIVRGNGLSRQALEQAITLAEEHYCPVSAMLSKAATISNSHQIIEE
ncbi:MAG: OsmC family protein [Ktedonobacteraceae bacterium]|nr:OsmC family protein [Ktedonobacteraceae bacterium]